MNINNQKREKMKKISFIFVCTAAAFGFSFATESNDWKREMMEENIEALAGVPEGETCYYSVTYREGSKILCCPACIWLDGTTEDWVGKTGTCKPDEL